MMELPSPNAPSSFWKRPEGITGALFLSGLLAGGGYLLLRHWAALLLLLQNTVYLALLLMGVAALFYVLLDPKLRRIVGYAYRGAMRRLTGLFVQLDPIAILKAHVADLHKNLRLMARQIGQLRGQMRQLQGLVAQNEQDIQQGLRLAEAAQRQGDNKQMVLQSRKAARLREANGKYQKLLARLDILYRILEKMYKSAEFLAEDTQDQVQLKSQERQALRAGHSAMRSAMRILRGDDAQRELFDRALEAMAEDVGQKLGEMERFMALSKQFMDSVELKEGAFEEQGLALLQAWEQQNAALLQGSKPSAPPPPRPDAGTRYDSLFE